MTAAHTPGPWKARDYRTNAGSIWIDCVAREKNGRSVAGTVAEVYQNGTGSSDPSVQQANALLIAASPDLLAVAAAIVKAADIGDLDHCTSTRRNDGTPDVRDIVRAARAAIAKAKGQPS